MSRRSVFLCLRRRAPLYGMYEGLRSLLCDSMWSLTLPRVGRTCPCRKPIDWRLTENRAMLLCNERSCQAHCLGGCRPRAAIEAEILTLRQQIIVLRRTAAKKKTFGAIDRLVFVGLYRLFPRVLDALAIVRPGTVIKWHRAGFRLYWRWKSRPRGGRPTVPLEIRRLIREMSIANPLWGAPRIHG